MLLCDSSGATESPFGETRTHPTERKLRLDLGIFLAPFLPFHGFYFLIILPYLLLSQAEDAEMAGLFDFDDEGEDVEARQARLNKQRRLEEKRLAVRGVWALY